MKALAVILLIILSPALAQFIAEQIPATPLFFIGAFVAFFFMVRFVVRAATS